MGKLKLLADKKLHMYNILVILTLMARSTASRTFCSLSLGSWIASGRDTYWLTHPLSLALFLRFFLHVCLSSSSFVLWSVLQLMSSVWSTPHPSVSAISCSSSCSAVTSRVRETSRSSPVLLLGDSFVTAHNVLILTSSKCTSLIVKSTSVSDVSLIKSRPKTASTFSYVERSSTICCTLSTFLNIS